MKKVLNLYVLLAVCALNAQQSVNNFKYVIVPKQFEFQRSQNQYKLNEMTEFLLEKYNFNAVSEGDLPEDLYRNNCLGLKALVVDDSNMFVTRLKVELRDCKNNLVYTSKVGKSKQKEYRATYQEALRRTFQSFKSLNYKYEPSESPLQESTEQPEVPVTPEPPKTEALKTEVVAEEVMTLPEETEEATNNDPAETAGQVLYAQAIPMGYQLIDTTPKVMFQLLKTSKEDVYLLKEKKGLFYKEGDFWIAEFWENDRLLKEKYQVKF